MSKIAFLGLGAMGSRMAPHLIKAGHNVTVWKFASRGYSCGRARGEIGGAAARSA